MRMPLKCQEHRRGKTGSSVPESLKSAVQISRLLSVNACRAEDDSQTSQKEAIELPDG